MRGKSPEPNRYKPMWMGGVVPLGYAVKDRKLIINKQEAETVRHIYNHYLVLKSVQAFKNYLDASGTRSKPHVRHVTSVILGPICLVLPVHHDLLLPLLSCQKPMRPQ